MIINIFKNILLIVFVLLINCRAKSLILPPVGTYLFADKQIEIKENPSSQSKNIGMLDEKVLIKVDSISSEVDIFKNIINYWVKINLPKKQGWIYYESLKEAPKSILLFNGFFLNKKNRIGISFESIPISGSLGATMGCPGGIGGFKIDDLLVNNPEEFILKLHYTFGDAEVDQKRSWKINSITNNSFSLTGEDKEIIKYEKSSYKECTKLF